MENGLKVRDIAGWLETWAPKALAESYDNVGLLVGQPGTEVTRVLVSLDCTEEVVKEAEEAGCQMIVSHHPVIFGGLKRLQGASDVERTVMRAVRSNIALYAIHTNLDNVLTGVNHQLAELVGCVPDSLQILRPMGAGLEKWSVFVPEAHAEAVRVAMADAGAGAIGRYDSCSFASKGMGSFRALEGAHPHVGTPGELHREAETKLEMVVPSTLASEVERAMLTAHPYEEVAFDRVALQQGRSDVGAGMVGMLAQPMAWEAFADQVKEVLGCQAIKHTAPVHANVQRIAVCGGSGSFLMGDAKRAKADVYITSDIKYHEYFQAEGRLQLLDVGHYESEWQTSSLIASKINEKFPNFAVRLSGIRTNPVSFR
ncbi:MAG: Nif3-like dinuclear metal center hexameric protein [Crocinitomicaceae bacterium]|nr:Nif3-like dinuclear metal center hexameric protein [Crocinitomicaceae bacterium]